MNAEIDLRAVTLFTPRLTLRPFQLSDLEDLYAYASLEGALDMIGRPPHKDRTESLAVLQRYVDGRKNFAMVYEGSVIGSFGIEKYDETLFPELDKMRCRELSFILSKAYWGRGLVPEAAREVIRWLFEEQQLDAILCGHFVKNTRSARVQQKCGFTHYAYRKYKTRFGTVEDDDVSILTKAAWERLQFSERLQSEKNA